MWLENSPNMITVGYKIDLKDNIPNTTLMACLLPLGLPCFVGRTAISNIFNNELTVSGARIDALFLLHLIFRASGQSSTVDTIVANFAVHHFSSSAICVVAALVFCGLLSDMSTSVWRCLAKITTYDSLYFRF